MLSDEIELPWVDASMIAGEFSNQSGLTFETSARFLDSFTLLVQLKFKEKLEVSIFSDPDSIQIILWGPFVSQDEHHFLSNQARNLTKTMPP